MRKVLIVDDHRLIFDGLKSAARVNTEFYYSPDTVQARKCVALDSLDACVIDLSLGQESGLTLLGDLAAILPCYVLTMHRSARLVTVARELGARGYFLKDEPLDLLFDAILKPWARDYWLSESLRRLAEPADGGCSDPFERLTLREKQVFVMLAEGLNYKEIAYRLSISPKTVNVHRDNIFGKMGFDSVADLVKKAIALKLVMLDEI